MVERLREDFKTVHDRHDACTVYEPLPPGPLPHPSLDPGPHARFVEIGIVSSEFVSGLFIDPSI